MQYVREVQLANMLGYTEMEDFRRAVCRGKIPAPARYLADNYRRPIWFRSEVETWLGIAMKQKDRDDFLQMIEDVI